jgi:mevalonate kinase
MAPAKVILCGEHAVNRGQPALALSVGLFATCTLRFAERQGDDEQYCFEGTDQTHHTTRDAILELARMLDRHRANDDYAAIQWIAAHDFYAPAKYVLAAAGETLPQSLTIGFTNRIPPSAGLGSGGATFVALAAALARLLEQDDPRLIATWAHRGDVVAHGGIASGLDTQTSLYGGAVRYTADSGAEQVPYHPGLSLVIGHSGVIAATSAVNERVRGWLAAQPSRIHYFHEIGLIARLAESALASGDWQQLGHLLNLNHLLLQQIGVSCSELDTLVNASLDAGALGAKLSGSGGGGIMVALTMPDRSAHVATAITAAGGAAIVTPISVPGVTLQMPEHAAPRHG